MASHSLGLTLHQAARQKGVTFTQENEPADRNVQANGMNFHYLEWGQPGKPLIVMLHGGSSAGPQLGLRQPTPFRKLPHHCYGPAGPRRQRLGRRRRLLG